ncbi:hypothetical protein BDA96_02G130400 [Sorghum bicolor]|uniref:CCHC-type domain-containing protein n=1 Tax=Sorghum bicolor TaxID=4558 RepID=A0A921UV18_SORBI|nr:hypothetical protein BDA96_02G130400 [Sorghum bicolor]
MAAYGLGDCETHIFDGANFALWKNHMLDHFRAKGPKFWWIVTNGLTHNLDHKNLTKVQKVLFELDCEAYCYLMKSLSFELFDRINSKGTAYKMWESIKHTFSDSSTWDDGKFKKEERKVDIHEDVEHDHNKHLLYVTTCSHEELKLVHEELCVTHDNLVKDHAFLTKKISNEEIKTSESSSLGSNDQSHIATNPCDVGKKHVSTSCDDLISMPCSSHIDACSTSMSCETNLLKENNELNEQVKNLSNKLERCYNSKVTFEHILKTQRNYGDKCGLGFKKKMTKGERKQGKRMKKLLQKKLSHTMCYRCHEMGHLANSCPNKEKLKKIKEEERLKHVKCFKCRTWGHLTSMCPTKKLVKQQEEPQPKPQVEQAKKPQAQVKFNHHGDLMMKKKKTRRGGRARHPMQIQDAKMMSKNEDKKKGYAHIKCFECKDDGHFASRCPTKLEKKTQATLKRQGNEKRHMSKEEKAQSKISCYLCRKRGHMAYSCPLGNNSKPISIDDNTMLRKDSNGTSMVAIAKHPATHTKALPKYVAPNLRGPKLVWVPSKSG